MTARLIAWQAATLDERLAAVSVGVPRADVPVTREVEALLRRWVTLFAGGDEGAFRRRLEWDGWSADALRNALAATPPADFAPSWIDSLAQILAAAADAGADYRSATWESEIRGLGGDVHPDLPFADAWLPFVRVALAAACAPPDAGILLAQARSAFGRQLALDLASASSLVLFEAFQEHGGDRSASAPSSEQDRSRYDQFVRHLFAGGLARIFTEYPALARHVAWLVESRAAALREMLARLEKDAPAIESAFGRPLGAVASALTGVSDPHAGGRRVVILQFASGWQLAYKPRDVGIEEAFNGFLRWCRAEGLGDLPAPLVVLSREGYGWMEVARREALADEAAVEAYYRRAGGLVCVAHLLRGHDLHGENIVAAGSGPALVDAEALCQPVRPAETPTGGDADATAGSLRDRPVESCLHTGLVTLRHPDAAGVYYDVGGLRPSGSRRVAAGRARWRGLRSNALHYDVCRDAAAAEANVPACRGQARPPERFRAAIVDGFQSAYRFLDARRDQLLAPGGPLAPFRGLPVRVLFRPSDRYAALLRVLAAPRYWRTGIERGIACDALNRVFAREVSRPPLWAFAAEERKALEQGDIPRFTVASDAQHAVAASGERVACYFQLSGLEAVRARAGAMSERDLSRQAAWLDAALFQEDQANPVGTSRRPTASTDVFVEAAERLGEELLRRGRRGAGDHGAWPVLGDRLDLYDGLAGPMLFFAALGKALGGDWREVAASLGLALAEQMSDGGGRQASLRGVGGGTGLGSLVYSLGVAGTLNDDPRMIAASRRAASAIVDRLPECADFDVVDGLAGAVLALVALNEMTGDVAALDQAAACARILVERQVPCGDGRAWPSRDGHVRAGFAHGAAGAAYSLVRFAAASGWAPARSAAVEALAFERSRYSSADRNWPAIRSDGGTALMTAWCHGAAGIGLGRAMMRGLFDEGGIEQEMRQAADTVIASGSAGLDHLCCGTFSRVESLLTAGTRAGQPAWVDAARALAGPVARRLREEGIAGARTGGFEYGLFQPGFFQGVSGIGYELLRVSQPSLLPSVAGFEAPAWRH